MAWSLRCRKWCRDCIGLGVREGQDFRTLNPKSFGAKCAGGWGLSFRSESLEVLGFSRFTPVPGRF